MISCELLECFNGSYLFDFHLIFPPQQLNLIGERDEVPIHFCDKCGLPIQLYGRMVCIISSFPFSVKNYQIFIELTFVCRQSEKC